MLQDGISAHENNTLYFSDFAQCNVTFVSFYFHYIGNML